MKVLMINGSPRPKGNTTIALEEIAGRLKKHGIDSEIVDIKSPAIPAEACREQRMRMARKDAPVSAG